MARCKKITSKTEYNSKILRIQMIMGKGEDNLTRSDTNELAILAVECEDWENRRDTTIQQMTQQALNQIPICTV